VYLSCESKEAWTALRHIFEYNLCLFVSRASRSSLLESNLGSYEVTASHKLDDIMEIHFNVIYGNQLVLCLQTGADERAIAWWERYDDFDTCSGQNHTWPNTQSNCKFNFINELQSQRERDRYSLELTNCSSLSAARHFKGMLLLEQPNEFLGTSLVMTITTFNIAHRYYSKTYILPADSVMLILKV